MVLSGSQTDGLAVVILGWNVASAGYYANNIIYALAHLREEIAASKHARPQGYEPES